MKDNVTEETENHRRKKRGSRKSFMCPAWCNGDVHINTLGTLVL